MILVQQEELRREPQVRAEPAPKGGLTSPEQTSSRVKKG